MVQRQRLQAQLPRFAAECFGRDISTQVVPGEENPFSRMYTRDMRTVHADLFGGPDGYLMDEDAELAALKAFVDAARHPTTEEF